MSSRAIQRELHAFNLDGGVTYLDNEPLDHVVAAPLYRERYVFVAPSTHRFAGRKTLTWAEAVADDQLCLLHDDMQNRRIIDKVAASLGASLRPPVVGNSFVNIAAHLRRHEWTSIVPHLFVDLFAMDKGLVALDLVDPVHQQLVGLVLSDREPRSPFANALIAAVAKLDFEAERARLRLDRTNQ